MTGTSKFISFVLRHDPQAAGLTLEPGGWVKVDDLLAGMAEAGQGISKPELLSLVAESDKQRFTLSADGMRIRAAQGHSVPVDLGLALSEPPAQLFHGTAKAHLEAILAQGLTPGKRQHVHLSSDEATAIKVGQRHGVPVVLQVDARRLYQSGQPFWRADNGVWLTDPVPAEYLALRGS